MFDSSNHDALRAWGKCQRQRFTAALARRGVVGEEFGMWTNCLYRAIFGRDAAQIREHLAIPRNVPLRDALPLAWLIQICEAEENASRLLNDPTISVTDALNSAVTYVITMH